MANHSLITALKNLRGNPRGCVYPEPLWGIPFNLYSPYTSIYMVALGLADKDIGLIVSLSWGLQIFMALLSGVVTDKLGRRRTTLIFDLLSWSVPALILMVAQNFWYFLIASLINSVWRITHNSWTCLLVEDAEPNQLADIYTWIYIANILVGFIAPLAGVLIATFSLVPTVRGLYLFAAVLFTVKALITYWMTTETRQGVIRLHETRHQSMWQVLGEYRGVFRELVRTPRTLTTAAIMLIVSITNLINGSFWSILVTQKLRLPAEQLAAFPFIKSAIILLIFFIITPRLKGLHFKFPMMVGFAGFVLSQVILITAPPLGYVALGLSVFLEACSFAAASPLVDQLTALTIDPQERARIQSILYVGIILLSSPFGWIAGTLSDLNKDLPFILNIMLFTLGAGLAYIAGSYQQSDGQAVVEPVTP